MHCVNVKERSLCRLRSYSAGGVDNSLCAGDRRSFVTSHRYILHTIVIDPSTIKKLF